MKREARKVSASFAVDENTIRRIRGEARFKRIVEVMLAQRLALAILDEGVAEISEKTLGKETVLKIEVVVLTKVKDGGEGGDIDWVVLKKVKFEQQELKYFNTMPFTLELDSDNTYNFLLEEE